MFHFRRTATTDGDSVVTDGTQVTLLADEQLAVDLSGSGEVYRLSMDRTFDRLAAINFVFDGFFATMTANDVTQGGIRDLIITFDSNGLIAGDHSATLAIDSNDSDEDPFLIELHAEVLADVPDIALSYDPGGDELQVGATVSLGSMQQGSGQSIQQRLYISNLGTAALTLHQISVPSGSGFALISTDFQLDANGDFVLQEDQTTSFVVEYRESLYLSPVNATTTLSSMVTIPNDDPNESPFTFNLLGAIQPAGSVIYLDDESMSDFSLSTNEPTELTKISVDDTTEGQDESFSRIESTSGTGIDGYAQWQTNVTAGFYRISATWPDGTRRKAAGHPDQDPVSQAAYTVLSNGVPQATRVVNQADAPNDRDDNRLSWEDLGVFYLTPGSLQVRLHAFVSAGTVVADGIRLEKVDVIADDFTLPKSRSSYRLDLMKNDPAVDLTTSDFDQDVAQAWQIVVDQAPGSGTLAIETDGMVTYHPTDPLQTTSDSFTYHLSNNTISTSVTSVTLHFVSGVAILANDSFSASHGRSTTFDVTADDLSPDGKRVIPVLTSQSEGWIDDTTHEIHGSTFYVSATTDPWTLNLNWTSNPANNHALAMFGTSTLAIKAAIEGISTTGVDGRPSGTVEVYEIADQLNFRVRFLGSLAETPFTVSATGVNLVQTRGTLVNNTDGTFTYSPNPEFFKLNGEYTEVFRYANDGETATEVLSV